MDVVGIRRERLDLQFRGLSHHELSRVNGTCVISVDIFASKSMRCGLLERRATACEDPRLAEHITAWRRASCREERVGDPFGRRDLDVRVRIGRRPRR
jgi:hypothetical protein